MQGGSPSGREAPAVDLGRPPEPDPLPLTAHLRWWLRFLSAGGPRRPLSLRATDVLRGTKWTFVLSCLLLVVEVADVAVSPSLKALQFPLRLALSVYSCLFVQFFTAWRGHRLRESFRGLIAVVDHLERRGVPAAKEHMRRSARRSWRVLAFYVGYILQLQVLMTVAFYVMDQGLPRAAASAVVAVTAGGPEAEARLLWWLRVAMYCLQWSASAVNSTATQVFTASLLTVYYAAAASWEAIGMAVEAGPCSRATLAAQGALLDTLRNADEALVDIIPHVMVVVIVVPLLSTVEVVAGRRAELFSFGTAPLVFAIFMPLCLAGDALAAARRGVQRRAYRGPWLEERVDGRRHRLALMCASQGRGGLARGLAIGYLDRAAFGKAIKSWFSFLQIMIKLLQ